MQEPPVPVRFQLPSTDWQATDPEPLGVTNVVFFAARHGLHEDFTPTLSVSGGWRTDGASLTAIADESVAKVREQGTEVELVDRHVVDSDTAPAVTQTIGAIAGIEGRRFDLRQIQVLFGYVDLEHPRRMAVMIYTLTCTYKQSPAMVEEFRAFMETVQVVEDPDTDTDPGTDPGTD